MKEYDDVFVEFIFVMYTVASNYYYFKFNDIEFSPRFKHPEYIHLIVNYFDYNDFDWNICL